MLEKYTEKARRVIFLARYEVSEFGSMAIEPEHLLLGLLREDKAALARFLPAGASAETIRGQVECGLAKGDRIPTSVEIPLSPLAKAVLEYAREESERLGHRHIGTEHLLLGLLQDAQEAGRVLREAGLELVVLRRQIKGDAE